jgi:hypothetical protein
MDITVKEGGLARRLAPIDKLKINTTDNKQSTWVPADKSNTGVLHASENGIYIASEDGYEAYSEVIVRVTKDSFEGDTSFDDWDYETPDMDLDNWDPGTIEDFELDPDGFNDIFNNEDEWKDIDKPIDIKMDNPKIQDTKISGIDPITGNEMEVGLDEDGYLTESTLPSTIKIEVPPAKLQYVDGQPIIFRGMVVKAYTADGELWTDANHSDGIIPHSELTFPVTTAVLTENEGSIRTLPADSLIREIVDPPIPIFTAQQVHALGSYDWVTYVAYSNTVKNSLFIYELDEVRMIAYFCAASAQPFMHGNTSIKKDWDVPTIVLDKHSAEYTENGKTVYYASTAFEVIETPYPYSIAKNVSSDICFDLIAWQMIYGDVIREGSMEVPVQYIRSDGEVLEDSFTIEVLPDPDGAHPTRTDSIEYNGSYYVANDDLNAEAHYASGTVWNRNTGAIYNTRDAVALGMLIPADGNGSQHVGGDF